MIISDLNVLETVTAGNVIGGCCMCYRYDDRNKNRNYKNDDRKYKNDRNDGKKDYDYKDNDGIKIVQETDVKVTVTPKISVY
ncbi:MAG: hypothetical protein EA343_24810 [Nodularia sp. (in: Bacteria)]|nr:MAG: hypothetical protein EA343_24810 [Nodularia sp. (in: cyanobacteria)]